MVVFAGEKNNGTAKKNGETTPFFARFFLEFGAFVLEIEGLD